MVSFQSIKTALAANPAAAMEVLAYRIRPSPIVESFKLPTISIAPAIIPIRQAVVHVASLAPVAPMVVQKAVRAASPARSETSEDALPPPPTRMMAQEAKPILEVSVKPELPTSPPKSPLPPLNMQAQPQTQANAQSKLQRTRYVDPICLGIEHADAMYAIASRNVQQTLECEEARRLEAQIGSLYKEESGRSRGWVKTKLEAFFIPRAATGSRVKEAFAWDKIWTDKEASAILDFVCLAKGIRCAVWKGGEGSAGNERVIGLWPAADSSKAAKNAIPIIHVGSVGSRDIHAAIREGWRLVAPYSVEHGLEKLSLDELDGLAEKMGIAIPSGKKGEKVHALASARMAMRISQS